MDKYKISIIIPVYNVALYIADCLNSIISQKGDYEVVIVNDGTEDESIDIAMRLTKGLKNITIINKSNGGLSSARNAGLKVASGDYISFVDSDDIVHEDYIKLISDEIDKNDADMIVFDYVKGSDTNEIKSSLKNQKKSKLKGNVALFENFSWMRVVKRNLYNNALFPEGYLYEDVYMSTILKSTAKRITILPKGLYGYRKREGSITTTSALKQFGIIDTLKLLKNEFKGIAAEKHYYNTVVNVSVSLLINYLRLNKKDRLIADEKIRSLYSTIDVRDILFCNLDVKAKLISLLFFYRLINKKTVTIISPIFKYLDKGSIINGS